MENKSDLVIRKLDMTDEPSLERLIDVVESNLNDRRLWLPISNASKEHFFDETWTVFYGAFDKDELIGTVGLFLNENEYGESQKEIHFEKYKIAEIGRIMCHPDYRRKGITSKIMKEMMDYATQFELDALLATAHPQNTASQKLLAKYGFKKEGHIIKSCDYERDILIRRMK
ncbi:MAG: GNAT family N-acetyltransferase [Lachnospiraceae bacterium]|nr:GNAT family N-acetyltransferase [Lachnospiraceae bacterium]